MKWKFCTKLHKETQPSPYFPPKTTTKLAGNWKTTTLALFVRGSLATTVTDMWPCPETESSLQSFIQVVYDAGQMKDVASDLTCVQILWLDWPKMCILWSLVSAASTLLTDTHPHSESAQQVMMIIAYTALFFSATSDDDHCLYSTILHSQADSLCLHVILTWPCCFMSTEARLIIRDEDGGGGGGGRGGRGWESEGLDGRSCLKDWRDCGHPTSQHWKLTLEKKILPLLLQGFEPTTFQSWVQCSNH